MVKLNRNDVLLNVAVSITDVLRPFYIADKMQVDGLKNIKDVEGPILWLPQHQSWEDIITLLGTWRQVNSPRMRIVARSDYLPDYPILSNSLRKTMEMSGLFHIIYRADEVNGDGEEKRRDNRKTIDSVVNEFSDGTSGVILPEGTTKNEGSISPLKSGCYFVAKTGVPCIAVGNTYDFMSGHEGLFKRKNLVFFNFGPVFSYTPAEKNEKETEEEYIKRDKKIFLEKIRENYLDLNTITTSQLGSLYLIKSSIDFDWKISFDGLRKSILSDVDRLKSLDGITIDLGLLDDNKKEERMKNFYDYVVDKKFIINFNEELYLEPFRVIRKPVDKKVYREENPIIHAANKILEVAKERKKIAERLNYFR